MLRVGEETTNGTVKGFGNVRAQGFCGQHFSQLFGLAPKSLY